MLFLFSHSDFINLKAMSVMLYNLTTNAMNLEKAFMSTATESVLDNPIVTPMKCKQTGALTGRVTELSPDKIKNIVGSFSMYEGTDVDENTGEEFYIGSEPTAFKFANVILHLRDVKYDKVSGEKSYVTKDMTAFVVCVTVPSQDISVMEYTCLVFRQHTYEDLISDCIESANNPAQMVSKAKTFSPIINETAKQYGIDLTPKTFGLYLLGKSKTDVNKIIKGSKVKDWNTNQEIYFGQLIVRGETKTMSAKYANKVVGKETKPSQEQNENGF